MGDFLRITPPTISLRYGRQLLMAAMALCAGTQSWAQASAEQPFLLEVLAGCPAHSPDASEFVVYDGRTNLLQGWNQASAHQTYAALKRAPSDYAVDNSGWRLIQECGQEKVFSALLVKKLGNWQGNHVNGIEPLFERAPIALGDIDAVILELKLDRAQSSLPKRAAFHAHFAFAASPEQLNSVDQQDFNFGITLFDAGFRDQAVATVNAQTRIALEPDIYGDQWLRVTIPVDQMATYLEQHYAPTDIALKDYADTPIIGLRINPETHSGKVVRNINGAPWQGEQEKAVAQNEMFKEMAVQLRKVALRLKPEREVSPQALAIPREVAK
ncbi:MAG TPA: hypothetical protein VIC26_08885 [Marinagarivorans sp.]